MTSHRPPASLAAALVTALLVLSALPSPASAYTSAVTTFDDGTLSRTVTVPFPPAPRFAGYASLLTNATVAGATASLSGERYALPVNFTHTATSGFPQGASDSGLEVSAQGLRDRVLSGSVEFTGESFDDGAFNGTVRTTAGVVLLGTSGTYITPPIAWNGLSYGHLIADADLGRAGSLAYAVVSATGQPLQTGLSPGALIAVNGASNPSVRLRATLLAPSPAQSPVLLRLGAGYALFEDMSQSGVASRNPTTLGYFAGGLELRESALNFTENPSNPVMGGAAGTWYAAGPLAGSAVAVGNQVWMYVMGIDGSGTEHIGRIVSSDAGASWTPDATPLLNRTPASWDSGYIGIPTVLFDGGIFKMWYMGAVTPDQFRIGYATSPDGITWTKFGANPVLGPGAGSAWDNHNVGWPNVVKVGSTFYLYYSGRPSTDSRKSAALATSSDGIAWTKSTSNPVIAWGSVSAGAYELTASEVYYSNGVFYLYWTCASTSTAYDTCVSTSTDATTFTHYNQNPIITHGDGTWDGITAELATRTVDPVTNHSLMFFTGRPGSIVYSLAFARPQRETPGQAIVIWNLTGERPHSLTAQALDAATPASTSLLASLSTSATGLSWGASESVQNPDTTIALAPNNYLRHTVELSTSDPLASPRLSSARIDYDLHMPRGTFTSAALAAPYPITNVTLWLNATVPSNTTLQMWASNDGGATWVAASNGTTAVFPTPGTSLRYKIALNGTTWVSPLVSRVTGFLGVDSTPSDVRLEAEDGTLLGQMAGELLAPVVVALDAGYFNAKLALYSALLPPFPLDFPLFVNASTAGVVHIEALRFDLRFPDLLKVTYSPDAPAILLDQGSAATFRVFASTTPGVPITYRWSADGALSAEEGPLFSFTAGPGSPGAHTVSVEVSNGEFTVNRAWGITVLPKPIYMVAVFYPNTHTVEVPVGLLQQFFASVAFAVFPATTTWTLDGRAAGTASSFDFWAPDLPGTHTLTVAATNGIDTLSWQWAIHVTAEPTAPSRQMSVAFAPASNLTLTAGEGATFFANASSTIPGVHYEWRVDGVAAGADQASLAYTTAASEVGRRVVSVLVRNETAIAAHAWGVEVLAPPPPAPPTILITTPAEGFDSQTDTVHVEGRTSPGATVTVNGQAASVAADGTFTADVPVRRGTNLLLAVATDAQARAASAEVGVTYTPPPVGTTTAPLLTGSDFPLLLLVLLLAGITGLLAFLFVRTRRQGGPPPAP